MATLEKAKLMNVDTNDTWDVLFNPKEYSVQKSVQWEPHKAPGLDTPEHEFTSGNPAVLNVELFFDTYEEKKDVRTEHTEKILDLAVVNADKHRPPKVMFAWGGFKFTGFIESLTVRYTMFLPDGKPCRATANVSMKELLTAKEQLEKKPRNSPDHTKRRTLKTGETLALIAHEEYDDPAEWRRIADAYQSPRVLVGEVYVLDVPAWARYYGSGSDELNLAFNFALVYADLDAEQMRRVVAATEAALPAGAWPCWIGSNHDVGRLTTRWAGGDEARARCALLVLLTLRGAACLYYGDELALPAGHVPPERALDVGDPPRDPARTPMPWTREGGWDDPWLPLEDTSRNVEDERADPGSTLHFARALITLRRELPDLHGGAYAELPAPEGAWAWRRGEGVVAAVNLGARPVEVAVEGRVALATDRSREGELVEGALALAPAEGAVLVPAGPLV